MPNLIPFQFEDCSVRVVIDGDEVWFVGADVARALGYKDEADAINAHCKRAKSLKNIASGESPDGVPGNAKLIQEPDVYRLIIRSCKRLKSLDYNESLESGFTNPHPIESLEIFMETIDV